jgi:Ca2+-binding RTX toxin-like protein
MRLHVFAAMTDVRGHARTGNLDMVNYIGTDANNFAVGGTETEMYGAGGDDYFFSNKPGYMYLDGGQGNDYINESGSIAGQFSYIYGGGGSDLVVGTIGFDYIEGGFDNDLLFGGTTNGITGGIIQPSTSVTASGDDTIYGGQGSDGAYGFDGNDTLYGGEGNDSDAITVTAGALALGAAYTGTGLAGLYGGLGNDYIDGGQGNDSLYGYVGDDYMIGGQGNDTMYGEDGNDVLIADSGSDLIYGGAGSDKIYGAAAYPTTTEYMTASGDAGTDTIYGGGNGDTIFGGTEADTVFGFGGSDTVYGGGGLDAVFGAAGNDYLYGGGNGDYFNLLYDVVSGETDFILDYSQASGDYIFAFKAYQNDASYSASGGYAYMYIPGASGGYTLGVNGLTAAQLQAQIIWV